MVSEDMSGRSSPRVNTVGDNAWERFPGGNMIFAVIMVVGIGLVATSESARPPARLAATVLLACCWFAGDIARHMLRHKHRRWVVNVYPVVLITLFAAAAVTSPASSVALFALGPQTFGVLPARRASVVVVILNLMPALRFLVVPPTRSALLSFGSTAALAITLSIAAGLWMCRIIEQSAERAGLIDQLRAAHAEVEQLSVERGKLAERERLAREIHDTLTQGFASIIMLLQAVEPAIDADTSAHHHLVMAAQTARENLAEARALVAELAPATLAGSLEEALRRLTERISTEGGIPVSFSVSGVSRDLPPDREVALLRVAQEALANVRKHACARSAAVMLAHEPDLERLTVRDDGRGFDVSAPASGFGLRGMRSRAGQFEGSLDVRTTPGQGTTITFEIPVSITAGDRAVSGVRAS